MKRIIYTVLLLFSSLTVSSQVTSYYFENKDVFAEYPFFKYISKEEIPVKIMPSFDVNKYLQEDKENEGLDIPFRFGYGFDGDYTLKDGVWKERDGKRIWSLRVFSDGAYSINFIFSKLALSPQAKLYIYNPDGRMVYGAVTAEQNIPSDFDSFLTDLIAGDEVIICLVEPSNVKETSSLTISRVVHAYVNMFSGNDESSAQSVALTCHNNVACYPDWEKESNGVALILLSTGTSVCSGSLINNTSQNNKPLFLTAFHCVDVYSPHGSIDSTEIARAQNWGYRFNYKTTTCDGSIISTTYFYNHAYFRAAWQPTDFTLMELIDTITHNATFSGWDRTGNNPSSGTGIHHPAGMVMKISFDNNALTSNSSILNWSDNTQSPINSHWTAGYDNGTTEGGSSGSPLFDQNHRVVGQLHGGYPGCPPVTKYYGKLNLSWTGNGTNSGRLSNWLDPNNTGVTILDVLCTTTVNFTDQTVTADTIVTSCCDIYVQDVTVTSGAKLTLDAENRTVINGAFEVELGSELEIK
jgi:V8-like Glu-specific endopeptidase